MSVLTWDLDAQEPFERVTIDTSGRQFTTGALTPDGRHLIASCASGRFVDRRTTVGALKGADVIGEVPCDIGGRSAGGSGWEQNAQEVHPELS